MVRRCLLAVGTDLWGTGEERLSPLIAVVTVPIRRPSAWAVGGGRAGWREVEEEWGRSGVGVVIR